MILSVKYIIAIIAILLVQFVTLFYFKNSKNKYKKYIPKTSYLIALIIVKLAIKIALGIQIVNYIN